MNAQGKADMAAIGELTEYEYYDRPAEDRIRARLTHLDKLERALAWRELWAHRIGLIGLEWIFYGGDANGYVEPHDGTPHDRAEALVRMWERVTGGGP